MITVNIEVDKSSRDNLKNHIQYIKRLLTMKTDKSFQKFIQNKVLETAKLISLRLIMSDVTNPEYVEEYIERHQIREEVGDGSSGFVLYNDLTIPAILSSNKGNSNYEEGFSIALAFEYGVGIVGENNPVKGAWDYNIHEYEKGWYYKSYTGQVLFTMGYKGMEIYRHIANECTSRMKEWVNEYFSKKEV